MDRMQIVEFLRTSDTFPAVFVDIAVGKVPSLIVDWYDTPKKYYSLVQGNDLICPLIQAAGGGDFLAYDVKNNKFLEWDYETAYVDHPAKSYQGFVAWLLLHFGIDGILTDEEFEETAKLFEYKYWPELFPTLEAFPDDRHVAEYFREVVADIDRREK